MKTSCRSFRGVLEQKLVGRGPNEFSQLAWHEHLLACAECRSLLQAEEALEILLATLPEPKLPAHLAARVVSRLRALRDEAAPMRESRAASLDALLELDRAERAPDRLAANVLARLQGERERAAQQVHERANEARLDALLDRDAYIAAPRGLAARVIAGLQGERGSKRSLRPVSMQPARSANVDVRMGRKTRTRTLLAIAAGLLAVWIGWALWPRAHPTAQRLDGEVASSALRSQRSAMPPTQDTLVASAAAPDAQMLAALDVLEQWDLLMQDDVDVLLSTIEPADEALLEYHDGAPPSATSNEKEPPSKG